MWPKHAYAPVTPTAIHFDYTTAALSWTKKKHSLRNEERIRCKKDRARKRTKKKTQEGKKRVVRNRRPREIAPGYSQKIEAR